tara:strand:+ start:143 stop:466 length:324 start_codon:yes stop_codon:yes gene_type:complete
MHTQKLTFTNGNVKVVVEPKINTEVIKDTNGVGHHVAHQYLTLNIHRPDGTVSQLTSLYKNNEQISITSPWLWSTINMMINSPKWESVIEQFDGPPTADEHLPEEYI